MCVCVLGGGGMKVGKERYISLKLLKLKGGREMHVYLDSCCYSSDGKSTCVSVRALMKCQ